jgi:nucleotide-binding universal stress UspA family protein
LDAAHNAFRQAAKAVGAPVHAQAKAGPGIGASFHSHEGVPEELITEEARLSDLAVFDLSAKSKDLEMRAVMESALLNAGRPLLLVPNEAAPVVGAKIAIGWDGGAAAANAVLSAVPLLKRADEIEILSITTDQPNTVHTDRVCDYLRLQGQTAVARSINQGSRDTAEVLVEAAQSSGAGLLVIGGYGHSRLREFVLGGVTRYVFANAAMPVFMAH